MFLLLLLVFFFRKAEFQSKRAIHGLVSKRLFSSNYSMLIYFTAILRRLNQMQGPCSRCFIELPSTVVLCEVAYDPLRIVLPKM